MSHPPCSTSPCPVFHRTSSLITEVLCCASYQHMFSLTSSHANCTLSHDDFNSQLTSYGHDFIVPCALFHSDSSSSPLNTLTRALHCTYALQFTTLELPPTRASSFTTHSCAIPAHKHHHGAHAIPSTHHYEPIMSLTHTVCCFKTSSSVYHIGGCVDALRHPLIFISYFTQCISTLMDVFPMRDLSGSLASCARGARLLQLYMRSSIHRQSTQSNLGH